MHNRKTGSFYYRWLELLKYSVNSTIFKLTLSDYAAQDFQSLLRKRTQTTRLEQIFGA